MKDFFSPEPLIFASQGGVNSYPRNTIPCFEEAFRLGADVVCINVHPSKDGIFMVLPDEKIEGFGGVNGPAAEYNAAELKEIDAGYNYTDGEENYPFRGKGMKFVSLEELLNYFPDKKFNITLLCKDIKTVKEYGSLIKKCGAESRILTVSLYGKVIKEVRKILPGTATAFSISGLLGVYALFKSGLLFFVSSFAADALQTAEKIGASYIANGGLIRQMQDRGVKVHVWGVNNETQLKRLYDAGADGYVTDHVEMVKEFLDKA